VIQEETDHGVVAPPNAARTRDSSKGTERFPLLIHSRRHALRRARETSTSAVVAVITRIVRYDSFQSYLEQEGLVRTLPGVQSIKEG